MSAPSTPNENLETRKRGQPHAARAIARTPKENLVSKDSLPEHRSKRVKTEFKGCTQLYQLFLKADGKLSCSCMRYWDILADARNENVGEFYNGEVMRYIRDSFSEGYEPFSFCEGCPSRLSSLATRPNSDLVSLHIEPSNQCNLYCDACLCTFERSTANTPSRVSLSIDVYEKALREIKSAGLTVDLIALVGFGEPLFNSRTPDMARLGRELFPSADIFLDTNANFGTKSAEELANCGLSRIRLSIDGVDQELYEPYRRNGEFNRAIEFSRALADAIRRTNSPTRAVWKYILFRHNDSDVQLRTAIRMAHDIGVSIIFDATVGQVASTRSPAEIEAIAGQPIGCNIDPSSTSGEMLRLGEPEAGTPYWRVLEKLKRRTPTEGL